MSFEIRLNGVPYTLWTSARVYRSIDTNSGMFIFSTSSRIPNADMPVKTGDFVEIIVSGQRKIAGFVDEIYGGHDVGAHYIDIAGRDNTADLIDSSVPDSVKVTKGPISLKAITEKVISALGAKIPVSVNVSGMSDFTSKDLQAAGVGMTCISYLVSLARKRQVYLIPDGAGGLIIFRPDPANEASTQLLHQINGKSNNVVSCSFRLSQADRFNRYMCKSQDNFGYDYSGDYSGNGTYRKAKVTDTQIRASRYTEIQAEESMTDQECAKRAAEESNLRRTLGMEYTAVVPGTEQADGSLWDIGQFVNIVDDYADISGKHLIKTVEYEIDINEGTRTRITCVPPDGYQVKARYEDSYTKIAKTGSGYKQQTPQEQLNIR